MSSTNYINEAFNELMGNEDHKNFENLSDIEENKEEIKVENLQVEENKNTNLKIRKFSTKTKRNLNPTPKECSICERMASGYIFYGVICCDGCKHFFHRCITSKNKYKCEKDGNCNLSYNINVCKSCRFDKCILKGMYIQTSKGRQPEKVLEIQTMIQNKRRELASKGKYVQGKSNNCAVEEINFVDLQNSIIAAQNKQSLDYLLTVEQNACRTRDSGIDECHYNSSCNSLASLLTRRENLIAIKHENIGMQTIPKSGRDPIEGFLVFSSPPKPLTDVLLTIVDTARTMPFFDKLDLSDKISQITTITMPTLALHFGYYCSRILSETVVAPHGVPIKSVFCSNIYKEDMTINKFIKKLFDDSLVPFNRIQLNNEEFVLLRAIIFSQFALGDLSRHGRQLLLTEAEKYSDILMKLLQNHYGPLAGAKRYAELLHLIEFCFNCGNDHCLFLNYTAYVTDRGYFHNSMPEALLNLCLGCKT
uniref:Nuclear receptor n=1 Tax=Meloidogyne incognita TaxID=6306 RepID=A0A914M9D1_MELIC